MMRNFITSKTCSIFLGSEQSLSSIGTTIAGSGLPLLLLTTRPGFVGLFAAARQTKARNWEHR